MLALQASMFWMAALCIPVVFHCVHLSRGCAECRWLHGVHLVMLVGMLYMFAVMAFGVHVVPSGVWLAVYLATSAAILVWMAARLLKHESIGCLWILALAQQAAMVYMWAPMRDWVPAASYAFGFYFAVEALGWTIKAASRGAFVFAAAGPTPATRPAGSLLDDACMTVMAASMAYMFLGMQLMMSTPRMGEPPPQSESAALTHPLAPPREPEAAAPALPQQAQVGAPSGPSLPTTPAVPLAPSYVVRPGDTLIGVATRLYKDPGLWRRIAKDNPGLDPHRLPVGRTIRLPEPVPIQ
jgi:hypothetical protein